MLARNITRDQVLATRVRTARGWWERLLGLMGKPALPPGEALLIERCRSIHTHFMRFPIDALFLDARGRVVGAIHQMAPWRIGRYFRAASCVLELPAGTLAATGTLVGDHVSLEGAD